MVARWRRFVILRRRPVRGAFSTVQTCHLSSILRTTNTHSNRCDGSPVLTNTTSERIRRSRSFASVPIGSNVTR